MITFMISVAVHVGILTIVSVPYALIGGWDRDFAVELFTDKRINALVAVITVGIPVLYYFIG